MKKSEKKVYLEMLLTTTHAVAGRNDSVTASSVAEFAECLFREYLRRAGATVNYAAVDPPEPRRPDQQMDLDWMRTAPTPAPPVAADAHDVTGSEEDFRSALALFAGAIKPERQLEILRDVFWPDAGAK